MNSRVTVIDYGSGNLHSVCKAFRELGADVRLSERPEDAAQAERLLLPGVGAFADAMAGLTRRNLDAAVHRFCESGRPFLGICLGMQMMLSESREFGTHPGLGLIAGEVLPIPQKQRFKVPHVGWSRIFPVGAPSWDSKTLLCDVAAGNRMYFVHSYSAVPIRETDRLADTDYGGIRIAAAVRRQNMTGLQFHPEKSGPIGLQILRRFLQQ